MQQFTNFFNGLFSENNFSSGPDADLALVKGPYKHESSNESATILEKIPQEVWEHNIISNLSLLDSKNLCLVLQKFKFIIQKDLDLAKNIFNHIKPSLDCKLSKTYDIDFYTPPAFSMSYYLNFLNLSVTDKNKITLEDRNKTDIHITELWGLKMVIRDHYKRGVSSYAPTYVERFEGLEYKIINNSIISDLNKLTLDKFMFYIKERAKREC